MESKVTTSIRAIPGEKLYNAAETLGTIATWCVFIILCIGILLCFLKLIRPIQIDTHYIKLVVMLEFLVRTALINVNFGFLMFQFFDRLIEYDIWFNWKITSESGIRRRLSGKLDEYKIPVLLINGNILALCFYLGSAIINGIVNIALRLPKTTA